jgi:reactive chlorine resistance protein C
MNTEREGLIMLHSVLRHSAKAPQHPAKTDHAAPSSRRAASEAPAKEHPVAVAGRELVRYGLVVVIAWIGALKYSAYEAAAIHPLIANSPLMSWLYTIFSVRALAATLGTLEIIAAVLIALRLLSPRLSAVGSLMAILLFLGTLSFLFTTPGVTAAGGFPVLSVLPGQFLLKDLVLLGASLWTLGDSLAAIRRRAPSGVPQQRQQSR